MTGLKDIREGLRANLSSIPGCQVSGYMLASPTPPVLQVFPDATDGVLYHVASRNGYVTWNMTVQGIVALTADVGSQMMLDEWLEPTGDRSVFAALEADSTLGGVCSDLIVRSADGYQEYVSAGAQGAFVAAMWHVEVIGTGG